MEREKLSSLVTEFQFIQQELMQSEGELTPTLEQHLKEYETKLATKVDAISYVLSRFKDERAYWKAKADQYKAVQKSVENAEERLRSYVKFSMETMNADQIEGDTDTLQLVDGRTVLEIEDEEQIPDQYTKTTVIKEIDKPVLEAALIAGLEVPGARLRKVKSLRVKPTRKI